MAVVLLLILVEKISRLIFLYSRFLQAEEAAVAVVVAEEAVAELMEEERAVAELVEAGGQPVEVANKEQHLAPAVRLPIQANLLYGKILPNRAATALLRLCRLLWPLLPAVKPAGYF